MRSSRLSSTLHKARRLRAMLERERLEASPSALRLLRLQLLLLKVQERLSGLIEPRGLGGMELVPVPVKVSSVGHGATRDGAHPSGRLPCTC